MLNDVAPAAPEKLSIPLAQAMTSGVLPRYSENILGDDQEPISLVILAPDRRAFLDLMASAGWQLADAPSPGNIGRALVAAWLAKPYATAPMTPAFWNDLPHDFGFQMPTDTKSLRQRHHARFWQTGMLDRNGMMVFVGTASFDDGLKWGITHHIDPNIDAEREFLVKSLLATGRVAEPERIGLVAPVLGTNMTGDAFFTDGVAVMLRLQPR